MSLGQDRERLDQLLSNPKAAYGESFQAHLLEQYKLYVESSQKVTDRRISTGNYLLTVNSFLLTVFGVASSQHLGGVWLAIVPVACLLVSFAWYSLVVSTETWVPVSTKSFTNWRAFFPWLRSAVSGDPLTTKREGAIRG